MKNPRKKAFSLLTISVFLHLFACFCSFYRDKIFVGIRWQSNEYYKEPNYWIWFFSWWSAQASLVTIIYFVYKLWKKSPKSYWNKVFSLIVINANIISAGVFTIGAIMGITPVAKSERPINIFFWEVNSKNFWWFYSVIWHYLAPFLTINYFARRENNFPKTYLGRRKLFLYSFIHPVIWFFFILVRPYLISGSENYHFSKETPHYPYFFFEWVGFNNFEQAFWAVMVVLFCLLLFWLSTLSFWNYAKFKIEDKSHFLFYKKKIIREKS